MTSENTHPDTRTRRTPIRRLLALPALLTACVSAPPLPDLAYDPAEVIRSLGWPDSVPLRDLADRHGFFIGTAVNAWRLTDRNEPIYRETLAREFNVVSHNSEMQFGSLSPRRGVHDFTRADLIVDFAEQHRMKVRGHALVWHYAQPSWLSESALTSAEIEDTLRQHITTTVGRYRGRVTWWDVVNEPLEYHGTTLRPSIWARNVPDYVAKAFQWARAADPDAQLFLNETHAEEGGPKADALYALVRDLRARGVPVDGVGLQFHENIVRPPSYEGVLANIRRLGELGVAVHITEMDVSIDGAPGSLGWKLQRQADVYRDVARACLDAPNCRTLVTWGFTDRHTWLSTYLGRPDQPLYFDGEYRPKWAYKAVHDVLGRR